MEQELSAQQRDALQGKLAMIQQLLALPSVNKHETRFEGEVALVAPREQLEPVATIVEEHLGAPLKEAGAAVPKELAKNPMTSAMGGVRKDQTLYVKPIDDGLSLYVAFWPWGGGARFTIKVGVHGT